MIGSLWKSIKEEDNYDDTQNNPIHLAAKVSGACCKYLGQRGCNPKVKNSKGELAKVLAKDAGCKESMRELRKVEKSFGKLGKNNEPYALALYDWTVERAPEIVEELKLLDPEATGYVNKKEFLDMLKKLGAPMAEEEKSELQDPDASTNKVETKILPLFDKKNDGTVDYADFLTGKKYVNKLYLMSAFEGKKKKKKKKGGKGKTRKTKLPFEIPVMPSADVMRPADGGPPIMYIPREQNATDLTRFSVNNPPANIIQNDCAWYLGEPKQQFVSMNDAAKFGDIDSIKLALSRGYNVDTRDRYYKTPLMSAAHYGNLDMCISLISYGADANARDNLQWTPLHHAAHAGMIDVVELLLNSGANVEARALNGATPLFRAIETSRLNVVELLVKRAGAKLQVENRKGMTPMDVAYFWADPRVIDVVKTKLDSLPPVKEKKGGRSSAKKPSAKRTQSPSKAEPAPPVVPDSAQQRSASESAVRRALADLTRTPRATMGSHIALGPIGGDPDQPEDVRYTPRQLLPLADDGIQKKAALMRAKQQRRDRFGWEVDFPAEFRNPFEENLQQRLVDAGGPEP